MKKLSTLALVLVLIPFELLFAQTRAAADIGYFTNLGTKLLGFVQGTLMPLLYAVALLMFVWGVFKTFILGGADSGKQEEGKQLMMYAVLGFVLMTAIWGIVHFVIGVFGITPTGAIDIPRSPTY